MAVHPNVRSLLLRRPIGKRVVLVTGSREAADRARVFQGLSDLHEAIKFNYLINGRAEGVDDLSSQWARWMREVGSSPVEDRTYPYIKEAGRGGGGLRNAQMLMLEAPDLVASFRGGPGTSDMMRRAFLNDVPVVVYETGIWTTWIPMGLGSVDDD